MPVGTAGTVKAMTADAVRATGARDRAGQHLPPDAAAGRRTRRAARRAAPVHGLARTRSSPIPAASRSCRWRSFGKIDADGVTFQSHLDGSTPSPDAGTRSSRSSICWTPRSPWRSTNARRSPPPRNRRARPCELSMRWAQQSREAFVRARRTTRCSASCRAASFRSCATASARALTAIGFEGYAVGGLAVGEGQATMFAVLDATPCRSCRPTGRAT